MKNTAAEVDEYIAKAPPFAQPILERVRRAFHDAHPDVSETVKWGMPFFEYKGIVGNMAAFKQHVSWGFWKSKLLMPDATRTRISDVSELPPHKEFVALVREAIRLNDEGVKVARPARKASAEVEVPDDLAAALKKNGAARKAFDAFPPSHRREYVQWITEAKQEATRQKRLAQAVEWIAEGKSRNWKYER